MICLHFVLPRFTCPPRKSVRRGGQRYATGTGDPRRVRSALSATASGRVRSVACPGPRVLGVEHTPSYTASPQRTPRASCPGHVRLWVFSREGCHSFVVPPNRFKYAHGKWRGPRREGIPGRRALVPQRPRQASRSNGEGHRWWLPRLLSRGDSEAHHCLLGEHSRWCCSTGNAPVKSFGGYGVKRAGRTMTSHTRYEREFKGPPVIMNR